jgi:ankyrin repeat protein
VPSGGASFLPARGAPTFPLHQAAHAGNLELAKQLVGAGYDVNQPDADGATPLMHAAIEGHYLMCKYLIDHGADVSLRDDDGWDLLRIAGGHPEIVRLVQEAGSSSERPG